MAKILLLEDDELISFGVQTYLECQGFQVLCCATVAEAEHCFSASVDLALLDVNLPDGNGYDFYSSIKKTADIPVIFLTVRDGEYDMVRGLDMGADDYIVKPFQLSVLNSRINAVLRRNGNTAAGLLTCGCIKVDRVACRAWSHDSEILLTAGEYRLLLTLMENKNRTLTRDALLERLWDADGSFVNDNTLTVTIKRLREKLGYPPCIHTLRGIGYRMEDQS